MRLSVESESESVPVDTSDTDERLLISEREELTTVGDLIFAFEVRFSSRPPDSTQ